MYALPRWHHDSGHRGLHLSVLLQRGLLNRLLDVHVSERNDLLCVRDGLLSCHRHGLLSMRQQLRGVLGRWRDGLHVVRGEQVPFVQSVQVVPNWLHQQRRHCDYLHCVSGLLVRPRHRHRYLRVRHWLHGRLVRDLRRRLQADCREPAYLRALRSWHVPDIDGKR